MRYLRDDDPTYPDCLRELPDPPRVLTTTGPLDRSPRVVAIVGARDPMPGSAELAFGLAHALASAGLVVVSGGAYGIDAAAHRGALAAGGRTWSVLPCGRKRVAFPGNRRLYQAISFAPGGRLVWPLPDDRRPETPAFRYRNAVLTALAHVVVVVQARHGSGSINAATWAEDLRRELWMVPGAPWMTRYGGSIAWIRRGRARPLWSVTEFLEAVAGGKAAFGPHGGAAEGDRAQVAPRRSRRSRPRSTPLSATLPGLCSEEERQVLSALSDVPAHVDQVASRSGLGVSAAVTALLTLALENVVVEGPDGFFRRKTAG